MASVSTKPVLAVLAMVLAGLFWTFLKETYWAMTAEAAIEELAMRLGMSRPAMIAAATPYLLSFAAALAVVWAGYSLGVRDRGLKPELEFVYSHTDHRFVRVHQHKTTYFVGLRVKAKRTIDSPWVFAFKGPFADKVIAAAHPQDVLSPNYLVLYRGGALDPTVMETIELFDLPHYEHLPKRDDLLAHAHIFTLEARGRDTVPARAEFEYDPEKTPMIRRRGSARWWRIWS
jgi:hypothetical protein